MSSINYSPYWWDSASLTEKPPPPLPSEADVVIVGAGFTGLSAALTLLRGGRSVVVVDKAKPGEGASTRNGGITSGYIRPTHTSISKKFGQAFADALWQESMAARRDLETFCKQEKIDADMQPRGWFRGAMTPRHFDSLQREGERLAQFCHIPCEVIHRRDQMAEINTDRFYGGLLQHDIGGFHPAKFFAGLLRLVEKEGGVVCHSTAVKDISPHITSHINLHSNLQGNGPGGLQARTSKLVVTEAGTIRAGVVVIATNGYTGREGAFTRFLRRRLVPVRSSIIVTEELGTEVVKAAMPKLRMYSSSALLTTYFRPTPDGKRILLGSRGSEDNPGLASVKFLKKRLLEILPQLKNSGKDSDSDIGVEYCWVGNVAFTKRFLPTIFTHDGIHYAGGYAGSGTVWARWCGIKLAQHMLGSNTPPSVLIGQPPPPVPCYDGVAWFMPAIFAYYGGCDAINRLRYG
ncbi:MAG: FAD-binding oxidoreductase [Proteobacteria bacterium]|nr:FAD-binding oxidoreductase [Pseudomonadota bacterium]